jgi:hypothetical protein
VQGKIGAKFLLGELEVFLGVLVGNVANKGSQKGVILGEEAVFDFLTHEVAEDPPKILVAGVGEEGAGIGQHPDEAGKEADGGEGVELIGHALVGVVEPPAGAPLNFARGGAFLKAATGRGADRVVAGVEVVDDGFGESSGAVQVVEKFEEAFALGIVADGVEAGVGAELGEVT